MMLKNQNFFYIFYIHLKHVPIPTNSLKINKFLERESWNKNEFILLFCTFTSANKSNALSDNFLYVFLIL